MFLSRTSRSIMVGGEGGISTYVFPFIILFGNKVRDPFGTGSTLIDPLSPALCLLDG